MTAAVEARDQGSGMADLGVSGLSGLRTRVEALGGRFSLHATPGVGTTVVGEFGPQSDAEAPAVAGV